MKYAQNIDARSICWKHILSTAGVHVYFIYRKAGDMLDDFYQLSADFCVTALRLVERFVDIVG